MRQVILEVHNLERSLRIPRCMTHGHSAFGKQAKFTVSRYEKFGNYFHFIKCVFVCVRVCI